MASDAVEPILRTEYLLRLEGVELEEQSKSATEKARDLLGYQSSTTLSDGLTRTIAWYRERAGSDDSPFAA